MSFQNRKTFVHPRKTNSDIFDQIRGLSDPSIYSNATAMFPGPET